MANGSSADKIRPGFINRTTILEDDDDILHLHPDGVHPPAFLNPESSVEASLSKFFPFGELPVLGRTGSRSVEAWFLGAKAENADELERLIVEAIRDHASWRKNYHPGDSPHVTETVKRTAEYAQAIDTLRGSFQSLLAFLKHSVPFFSPRYQGHMLWDQSLPAVAGYFAAMLFNSNNCAFEASTATTILEMLVAEDLCRMIGFSSQSAGFGVGPWGHITSGGTVANLEAMWSARNLKMYPIALQAAIRNEPILETARTLRIFVPSRGASIPLVDLDVWTLLNLPVDEVLALPTRLSAEMHMSSDDLSTAMARFSLQSLGFADFARRYLSNLEHMPIFIVPGTKHYSFPKGAALLGVGAAQLVDVAVDVDARMDMTLLRKVLTECLDNRVPVYMVTAIIGSTEESAVDPIAEVLAMREEFRARGLEFSVHADAAWGGYMVAMLRDDEPDVYPPTPPAPVHPPPIPMSKYCEDQFKALGGADSVTVDPHKSGYVPYPAGVLCYRNSAMRDLVTFKAPYVFHGDAEPSVGMYGIEGSRPGAAAASVFLAHQVIRPTKSGYGLLHGKAQFNCKRVYARLLTMGKPRDNFVITPVPRLPAERCGGDVGAQTEFIRRRISEPSITELTADAEAMAMMPELGPDSNIICYAVNIKNPEGSLNKSVITANRLNKAIYQRLSMRPGDVCFAHNLIVSTTDFDPATYGDNFLADFKRRMGLRADSSTSVTVLRSTVMDPWMASVGRAPFLDIFEHELRAAIKDALYDDSLSNIFEDADADGNEELDFNEVRERFEKLGYSATDATSFWKMADADDNGTISKDEFHKAFGPYLVSRHRKRRPSALPTSSALSFDPSSDGSPPGRCSPPIFFPSPSVSSSSVGSFSLRIAPQSLPSLQPPSAQCRPSTSQSSGASTAPAVELTVPYMEQIAPRRWMAAPDAGTDVMSMLRESGGLTRTSSISVSPPFPDSPTSFA